MDELKQYRNKIDEIDEKLTALFEERLKVVLKVAEYKKMNNIPILDEGREKEVIEKNKARLQNKSFENSLEKFYINIMTLSKEEQEKIYE